MSKFWTSVMAIVAVLICLGVLVMVALSPKAYIVGGLCAVLALAVLTLFNVEPDSRFFSKDSLIVFVAMYLAYKISLHNTGSEYISYINGVIVAIAAFLRGGIKIKVERVDDPL